MQLLEISFQPESLQPVDEVIRWDAAFRDLAGCQLEVHTLPAFQLFFDATCRARHPTNTRHSTLRLLPNLHHRQQPSTDSCDIRHLDPRKLANIFGLHRLTYSSARFPLLPHFPLTTMVDALGSLDLILCASCSAAGTMICSGCNLVKVSLSLPAQSVS